MRILEYAWNTLTNVSKTEYDGIRLLLDESLPRPMIGREASGYVVKLPVPRKEREGIYSLQGLYADTDNQNWTTLWRLFRASLYHAAFHVLHSDVERYIEWARGKDRYAAIYAVSLVEDYKITVMAHREWSPLLQDIAYANFISAMRMRDPDQVSNGGFRATLKLLLEVWGVSTRSEPRGDEDTEVVKVGNRVRSLVQRFVYGSVGVEALVDAAAAAYELVDSKGVLTQIPSFPHTESHSGGEAFESRLVEGRQGGTARLEGAYEALGVNLEKDQVAPHVAEGRDALQAIIDHESRATKIREHYINTISSTRLEGVEFPRADICSFMRTRSELAGPIRSIRDRIMQVRNVLDENQGEESGQVDMQAAMQVVASKQVRTDVFWRDQLMGKEEAWAILIDASKSISQASVQLRGMTTCLAEVANGLMREKSRWAVFAFSNTFQIVKDFDEAYTIDSKARIGGLVQGGPTYLPDALVTAARALNTRPLDSKYLVVVSDCLPTGYRGIEDELKKRIEAVSRSGVMLLGLGVQSSAVSKYFKVNCVMTTPHELVKFFVKAYMELSSSS
ncbi:MAG: VWA domain-containing protein [Nitrososphaerales archaeon]|nr:VWA domain-containing protein [Nitrososphaerales archaeon]